MIGKCKNCGWWQLDKTSKYNEVFEPTDPDTFEPMPVTFEVRYCKSPKLLFWERPLESDGATLTDGSNYRATLITGEDFGCVNFQPSQNGREPVGEGAA